jgi:hypothetical protein
MERARPITVAAGHYAWHQLAQRAGVARASGTPHTDFEGLGVNVHYRAPERTQVDGLSIIVVPCQEEAWSALLEHGERSLSWTPTARCVPPGVRLPFVDPVPVLFWGAGCEDGRKPFAERRGNGTVVFYADIIAATLFMLSRWEEMVVPTRDAHDRFPAGASVAYKQGFLDRPIVDEYALILQAWLKVLLPQWEPEIARFSVQLSHDIDTVRSYANLWSAARGCAGDLLRRHNPQKALRTLRGHLNRTCDPMYQGIFELADLSEKHGLASAFYFMGAKTSCYDRGYDPSSPWVAQCLRDLRERGHEIGFHAGYYASDDVACFAREKSRVEDVLGSGPTGGRQHYLRFRAPDTWRIWEAAGMTYDSTLGYADHEGFRCGTCHPFHPFDLEHERELVLTERPLIVMDRTLRQYRGLTPETGQERILTLAERCRRVNGTFTLLWHNSSLHNEWVPWAQMYRRLLPALSNSGGIVLSTRSRGGSLSNVRV